MQRSNNIFKSLGYAIQGIKTALHYNRNLKIHFCVAAVVLILGFALQVTPVEMGILSVLIVLVICCEMINSVIEEMVNLIVKEHREEARIAKDVAAGMVLIAALGALAVGIIVFTPYMWRIAS